ncbi:LuxR C-terminal-related transcriptional regulator [Streptomyces sp. 4F14]|uniref:LuxR C-terminal-related transcriptional regulator n=1 Tax=Streptomyces sp. 4F14 TaxID=3394380 RepID=UPI003A839FFE
MADVLGTTGEAARVLLVTAGFGAGRTTVLEQARRTAARAGVTVVRLAGEGEDDGPRDPADAVLTAAGGHLVLTGPATLHAGIPRAARSRLRAGGMEGLSALSEALASVARRMPLALVVDDADLLPEPAADALGLLLRVFRPYGVPVVLAGRDRSARAAADEVLGLPPLRPDDVARLVGLHVTRRFGRPADPALADAVARSLGSLAGNPRAVLSVLGTLDGRDLIELDGLLCLTRADLRLAAEDAFLLGFGRPHEPPYPGIVEAAIVTARVLDHADVHLDDAFRMTSPAGAQALERRLDRLIMDGVLTTDDRGRLSFAVPALAAALRDLPYERDVQANSARYVTALADRIGAEATGRGYPRLADRVAASGPLVPDSLAVPLLLAAAREEARTDWPRAARAYAAALDRLPPGDPRTPDALHEASALSLRHGDHAGLLGLGGVLEAVLDARGAQLVGETAELQSVAATRAWAALHEHHIDRVPATPIDLFPVAAELAALGGLYGVGPLTPRRTADAHPLPQTGPGGHRTPLPSPVELRLVAAAVGSRAELGQARRGLPVDALDDGTLDRLRDAAAYGDLAGAFGAVLGDRYVTEVDSVAAGYRGMVREHLAGDWDAALAAARRIEVRVRTRAVAGDPCLPRVLAAEMHCARGDVVRARAWLDLVPDAFAHPLAGRVRLAVGYWSGQREAALERARRDARRARKDGRLAGVERLLLRVVSLAALDGRPDTVREVVEELETLHEEADTPMTHEALLMARALADQDTDSALSAHRLVLRRGDAHLGALCCLRLAHLADDPRPWLTEAVRDARRLGLGGPFRTAVHRVADLRGIPLPRLRKADAQLSDADIRLVRMVSDGATNRRIAAELACSPKTVEQRLARLFRRTGCRTRTELAAFWLNEHLDRQGPGTDPTARGRRSVGAGP